MQNNPRQREQDFINDYAQLIRRAKQARRSHQRLSEIRDALGDTAPTAAERRKGRAVGSAAGLSLGGILGSLISAAVTKGRGSAATMGTLPGAITGGIVGNLSGKNMFAGNESRERAKDLVENYFSQGRG